MPNISKSLVASLAVAAAATGAHSTASRVANRHSTAGTPKERPAKVMTPDDERMAKAEAKRLRKGMFRAIVAGTLD